MRLLIVSQDFPPATGGIQTYAHELARHLGPACDTVHVLAPRQPGDAEIDAELPAIVHRVPTGSDALSVVTAPVVAGLARRHRLDTVLHAQWMTAAGSLLARRSGWPQRVFSAAHGRELLLQPFSTRPRLQAIFDRARRATLQGLDGVVAVSRYTAGLVGDLGVAPERIAVVGNGTDPTRFDPLRSRARAEALRERFVPRGRAVMVTVSRLMPHKGIDTALQSLARLVARGLDVQYLVVGDGPDRERLVGLTDALGLTERVSFVGRAAYEDVPAYLGLADVFVMLSRVAWPSVEGFGIAFVEANAAGTPVVGTRTGGIPDAVVDGETGVLVAPDDPEAAADAIGSLLVDRDRAVRMGQCGRARVVASMGWDRVAQRMAGLLRAGLDGIAGPRTRPADAAAPAWGRTG